MQDSIRVHVVDKGRTRLYMRYRCPVTGKEETRSTGTSKPKEAAKVAAKWEAELQEGRYQRTSRMGWDEFRRAWESANWQGMAESTRVNYDAMFGYFERLISPDCLGRLTSAAVAEFTAKLRQPHKRKRKDGTVRTYKLSEASVDRHLRSLRAVARWAHRQEMLPKLPNFEMPKRAAVQRMKGRPITTEEFERMLAAVPKVLDNKAAEPWQTLLRGLWWSGLRLSEALALRWDHRPGGVSVRLAGRESVLVFDGDAQKNRKAEVAPLAPEAVAFLESIQRPRGHIFAPLNPSGTPMARDKVKASKIIGRIGQAAGVVVDTERGKTASAHDLRRAFGLRWSQRVMPTQLKALMRHTSIQTTMAFYVGNDATATSAALWSAVGDTLGDTPALHGRPTLENKHPELDSNQQPTA